MGVDHGAALPDVYGDVQHMCRFCGETGESIGRRTETRLHGCVVNLKIGLRSTKPPSVPVLPTTISEELHASNLACSTDLPERCRGGIELRKHKEYYVCANMEKDGSRSSAHAMNKAGTLQIE